MPIYLDNAATTHLDPEVAKAMAPFQGNMVGNASSLHALGIAAAKGIESARNAVARRIHADPAEVIFTSGGTEANNLALKGVALANRARGTHLIVSAIEHPSVLYTARWLESHGFSVTYLPVDREGFVDPSGLKNHLTDKTILVSIMHANNEIGTIEPIKEIGRLCRERGVYFHTDACQSFTKADLDVEEQCLDLVSLNAHKIHGPRGVGALFHRKGVTIEPLFHGGGHEDNLRSGTYNTEGIVGFGKAVEIADRALAEDMEQRRDYFIAALERSVEGWSLNGPRRGRLCNTVNITFASPDNKTFFRALNERDIMVSAGSACFSRKNTPSHVLLATGLSAEQAHRSLRFSLSKWTTKEEIDRTVEAIVEILKVTKEPPHDGKMP